MESKLNYIKKQIRNYSDWNHNDLDEESIDIIYNLYCNGIIDENMPLPSKCLVYLGLYFFYLDNEKSFRYLSFAVENGDIIAMRLMAQYYDRQQDTDNVIKYFQMAIDHGDIYSIQSLGGFYRDQKLYDKMIKCYCIAYSRGDKGSLCVLVNIIYDHYEIVPILKSILVEHRDSKLMKKLAHLFKINKPELAQKILLMAIDQGDVEALYLLGVYSLQQGYMQDHIKYFMMAFDHGYPEEEIRSALSKYGPSMIDYIITNHQEKQKLLAENQKLKMDLEEKENQILELTYCPGGPGYQDAKNHFYANC